MSDVSINNQNGMCTIFLGGRIDSTNAAQTETEITDLLSSETYSSVVIDMEKLKYISSAGLRVILRLLKKEPSLSVINVTQEVYEILEMTGFTEMMDVKKAYRRLSVEGCEVIGQGANGKVYRIDADTIIKVYFNSDALPDIHRERELARKAFILGIPTAIPYDVVKVDDSYGSVFELLNASSFAQLMNAEPEKIDYYIGLYVDLLKKIHATEVTPGAMPDMREVALNWVSFLKEYIPADQYEKLYSLVENVPVDYHMMHGDYHIKNVMMQNGEVLLIDMDTLCYGHPIFELASIYLAYCGYPQNDHSNLESFLGITWETGVHIWKKTLSLYFNTEDEELLKKYEDKARLMGSIRMLRRTIRRNGFNTEIGLKNINSCKKTIEELVKTVDSLTF